VLVSQLPEPCQHRVTVVGLVTLKAQNRAILDHRYLAVGDLAQAAVFGEPASS
jgi:hypothetical protein